MTLERALINQAGSHIVANKLRNFIRAEINKGCSSNIASYPVSLEPNFNPIWAAVDRQELQDHSEYTIEAQVAVKDLVRRQIWISPEQEFNFDNSELFLKQLQTISFWFCFEVSGNSKNIMINFLCNRFDLPIINAAFQSAFEYCELCFLSYLEKCGKILISGIIFHIHLIIIC